LVVMHVVVREEAVFVACLRKSRNNKHSFQKQT
jgi:hypothetical protein